MRTCNNCKKPIPLGSNHIEVRVFGFPYEGADFCKPECFEQYYAEKRYALTQSR